MNALILIIIILAVTFQQVFQKIYNNRVTGGAYTFAAAASLCAVPVFLIASGGQFSYTPDLLIYSILFAVSYAVAVAFNLLAISAGPLSLTALIVQYALCVPAIYGLAVLGEPITVWLIVGILLLCISLIFINLEKKGEEKKITLKWGIFALLAFIGNGCCSTVGKVQQINCEGRGKSEFMIVALLIASAALFIAAIFAERKAIAPSLKKGFIWCLLFGIANGMSNLLALVMATRMPASVLYPLISAGGIVAAIAVSVTVYREKLSKSQIFGVLLGILAIIAFNL